jgi:metallophosphoesterase (TIGR00282 family)
MPNNELKVLFLGDIVGSPGRLSVKAFLETHRKEYDFVFANCENATSGKGLNPEHLGNLLSYGIDVLTSGNHIWYHKEIFPYLKEKPVVRPLNYPPGTPGEGYTIFQTHSGSRIAILNVMGRVLITELDCPFRSIDAVLEELPKDVKIILVDFHAETTSEKRAMGFYLDGRVTAMVGTHTHVQTNDFKILPEGTAYITDAGMCGPEDSVIGVDKDLVIQKYLTCLPTFFKVAEKGPKRVDFVSLVIDIDSGKASQIKAGCEFFQI